MLPRLNYRISSLAIPLLLKSLFLSKHDLTPIYTLFGHNRIFFVNQARTGLRLLLNSLNLPAGAFIGVQAYNCQSVFWTIKKSGFRCLFIDIDKTFTISPKDLQCKKNKISALIVTHTFGIPADLDKIKKITGDIPIIEDCAHSFLTQYNQHLTGTLCTASIFSIGRGKCPSIGDGGFVVINDPVISDNFLKCYANLPQPNIYYEFTNIAKIITMWILHSKILYGLLTCRISSYLVKLNRIKPYQPTKETKYLKTIIWLFLSQLSLFKSDIQDQICFGHELELITNSKYNNSFKSIDSSYFLFPLLVDSKETSEFIINYFASNGIEIGRHFSNSINWAESFDYEKGSCPNTEDIVTRIITIPTHYMLTNKERKKISALLEGSIS
ncbi:MAG: hypothetical protein GYA51_07080 [Candidatus Methanofastidiosa archaeon]|nr:hypothetical protein [Candidatus Methanofastidiosa archaeon]